MLFYFSGTGNSLHAAQALRARLGGALVDMAGALRCGRLRYALAPGEPLGFVLPVYFFGVPTIVTEFIERAQISAPEGVYAFAALTCGGSAGAAGQMLRDLLARRGLPLQAAFEVVMPDNYALLYNPPADEAARATLEAADAHLSRIADACRAREARAPIGAAARLKTALLYPFYLRGRSTRKFHADQRCQGCGLCARVCPARAIVMRGARPVWEQPRCAHCLACLSRCPAQALQYGGGTKRRRRYVHPDLTKK